MKGKTMRYIRKKLGDMYVLPWSEALLARGDMVECDCKGNEIGDLLPRRALAIAIAPVKEPELGTVAVPYPAPAPVEPPVSTAPAEPEATETASEAETVVVPEKPTLDAMTKPELLAYAKAKGIKVDGRCGPEALRAAITKAETSEF